MMKYQGKYRIFNPDRIRTYPVRTRTNKTGIEDMVKLSDVDGLAGACSDDAAKGIEEIATAIVSSRGEGKPVVLFTGAHLVKNGLSGLLVDLVRRGVVSLVAGNGATAIHDFEMALMGATSEYVPEALETGRFGMAYEFCYQNVALQLGNKAHLGYGESLGKMICDESFRNQVMAVVRRKDCLSEFAHPDISVLAACYEMDIPFTVHVGIGTDVIDQHASFDGQAKGGCSGRDFLIYAQEICNLADGGVVLNIGSAVTGPEVFLKAVSMAANVGRTPRGIVTADFDLRPYVGDDVTDESRPGYYLRGQKSIVTRVPQAYGGKGYYIEGNQKHTFPLLYKSIVEHCDGIVGR